MSLFNLPSRSKNFLLGTCLLRSNLHATSTGHLFAISTPPFPIPTCSFHILSMSSHLLRPTLPPLIHNQHVHSPSNPYIPHRTYLHLPYACSATRQERRSFPANRARCGIKGRGKGYGREVVGSISSVMHVMRVLLFPEYNLSTSPTGKSRIRTAREEEYIFCKRCMRSQERNEMDIASAGE
jgi:hypothetical protein